MSPTEIALTLGFLDQSPNGLPFIEENVTIVLTPHHAKTLANALTAAMNIFETQYGAIE